MNFILRKKTLEGLLLGAFIAWSAPELKADECPMHAAHQKETVKGASGTSAAPRLDGVDMRGDEAMGFDHAKTTHHFFLNADGGAIQVEANEASDNGSRDAIRSHLAHIAGRFTDGDFDVPMFIHERVPPGVPAMKEKRKAISYAFEPMEKGGRVRIATRDVEALAAIHAFLRFQILDHRTGDPAESPRGR